MKIWLAVESTAILIDRHSDWLSLLLWLALWLTYWLALSVTLWLTNTLKLSRTDTRNTSYMKQCNRTFKNTNTAASTKQYTALHCTVLYCTIVYSTALHCPTLCCCTVMCCIALLYSALHCSILHCTPLYSTMLNCSTLCCNVPMRLAVSGVSGVCTVMKSLLAHISSRSALSIPTWEGEHVCVRVCEC